MYLEELHGWSEEPQQQSPITAGASSCCLSLCRLFRTEEGLQPTVEGSCNIDLWTNASLMMTSLIETQVYYQYLPLFYYVY